MAARVSAPGAAAVVGIVMAWVAVTGCGSVDTMAVNVDGGSGGAGGVTGAGGSDAGSSMRGPTPKTGAGGAPAGSDAGNAGGDGGGASTDAVVAPDVPRECEPGARTCEGTVPVTCDSTGRLQRGAACPHTCRAGACAGDCTPGELGCDGLLPRTCNADGQWEVGSACEFVCRAGACAGTCRPDARQCGPGGVPQTCDALGAWVSAPAACPFLCKGGTCTGSCKPQAVGCSGTVPQVCGADAEWVSGQACPRLCSAGACTDGCTTGAHQCSDGVPQTCDAAGSWQDGAACPFVCAAGVCGGVCVPEKTRCVNAQLQACDATGTWQVTGRATRELLVNPAFDAGRSGWSEMALVGQIIRQDVGDDTLDTTAHTPRFLAWLSGYDLAADDLFQTVALPPAALAVTLTFYYQVYTEERVGGAAFDFLDVEVRAPGGAAVPLGQLTDNNATSTWTRFSATLPSDLVGQTVELHFRARSDATLLTSFYVDTVSLEALVCP